MREHPGTPYPAAKRAVARHSAAQPDPGAHPIPWARRGRPDIAAPCFFCGNADSLIRSSGDLRPDRRRVQVYCDNDQCDAREVEVIVVDDATMATAERTDVRILRKFPPVSQRPVSSLIEDVGDWIPGSMPAARAAASVCLFCGERTCLPGPADRDSDTGRISLECSNAGCDVVGMEVLVMRDGTPWTQDRDDIAALGDLIPRRAGTKVGGITIYSVSDLDFTDDEVLAARVSGPMPR